MSAPRIAIVHDNFAQMGGAERVAAALSSTIPEADLFTTLAVPEKLSQSLREKTIRTTWMQRLPNIERFYRHYFPLYPLGIQALNLSPYNLIISSCFGYAKGLKRGAKAIHVCYCHTPPRWIWRYEDYSKREKFGIVQRAALALLLRALKRWDLKASQRPDFFIANSQTVANRIRAIYGREAVVIPPPIEIERFSISPEIDDAYLVVSRLSAYKRIDLAIAACNLLRRRLVIIGSGPDRNRLESIAGPTIEFLGRQPDKVVAEKLARCRALLFTGEEDFGMVPLEANAAGRPVIAFAAGGALETVKDGITGVLFDQPSPESLCTAIERFEPLSWNPTTLRLHAESFGSEIFAVRIREFLSRAVPSAFSEVLGEPNHL